MRAYCRRGPSLALHSGIGLCVILTLAGCRLIKPPQPAPVPPPPVAMPAAKPPPATPKATSSSCSFTCKVDSVVVRRYSRTPVIVSEHLHPDGCNGPFAYTMAKVRGTLKQVGGSPAQYFPPSRDADPDGRVNSDTIAITIECPHGKKLDCKMAITIVDYGR